MGVYQALANRNLLGFFIFCVCVRVGWEEEGKKEKEEKERVVEGEKERALLPPFFVNKSDLQNKRMATF